MELIYKLRLFCGSDRTVEEITKLFTKVSVAQSNGVRIEEAIKSAIDTTHDTVVPELPDATQYRHDNAVVYLVNRHKAEFLDLRGKGYGYVRIAKILAKNKIYNKKTNKAYSPATIRNVCDVLEKGKR